MSKVLKQNELHIEVIHNDPRLEKQIGEYDIHVEDLVLGWILENGYLPTDGDRFNFYFDDMLVQYSLSFKTIYPAEKSVQIFIMAEDTEQL